MNPCPLRVPIFAAGLLLAGALGLPSVRGASAPPTIQQQIDALLKHRLRPEPLPIDLPNPFLVISGGIRDVVAVGDASKSPARGGSDAAANAAANPTEKLTTASSAEMLARSALQLKIGGIIRIKDQFQLVINDSPRKEGDFISADWNGATIHLRVIHIASGELTLRLGDAELTLKF